MKINIPANTKTVILNIVSNEMIELNKAVNDAKVKLGLSNSELSKLIGHSRNYLSEALRVGISTEKQAEIVSDIKKAMELELINRGVIGKNALIDVSCSQDQSVMSEFVSKAYHEQEVAKYQKELIEVHNELKEVFNGGSIKDFQINASAKAIKEQKQNVRMLNMEVEQLKQAKKLIENDLAIANRDKNFMKKKLQDKNLVINWLVASNVFFILFLVAKCAGWV